MNAIDKGGRTLRLGDTVEIEVQVPIVAVQGDINSTNAEMQLIVPTQPSMMVVNSGDVFLQGTAFVDIALEEVSTPEVPSNILATSVNVLELTVSWGNEETVDPDLDFLVEYDTSSEFDSSPIVTIVDPDQREKVFSDLTAGTYYVRVMARNSVGEVSDWSDVSNTTLLIGAIASSDLLNPGTGYSANDVLTAIGGDSNATFTAEEVDGGGGVTVLTTATQGTGYVVDEICSMSGGDGSGAQIKVTVIS